MVLYVFWIVCEHIIVSNQANERADGQLGFFPCWILDHLGAKTLQIKLLTRRAYTFKVLTANALPHNLLFTHSETKKQHYYS